MSRDETTTISEKTKLPLRLVVTICAAVVAASAGYFSLKGDLKEIREAQNATWSRIEMSEWTRDFQEANPATKVPIVRAKVASTYNERAGAQSAQTQRNP